MVIYLGHPSPGTSSGLPAAHRCRCGRCGSHLAAYLALLRLGVAVPPPLPAVRWALTPPFHPYPSPLRGRGGLFSVALSVALRRPGVTWQSTRWSSDFPREANPSRPSVRPCRKLTSSRLPRSKVSPWYPASGPGRPGLPEPPTGAGRPPPATAPPTLTATSRSRATSRARKTTPIPPRPNSRPRAYPSPSAACSMPVSSRSGMIKPDTSTSCRIDS